MIDLHNHVLFGLDDGCRTIEESKGLAEAAKAAGHSAFVATPHIRPGMFNNNPTSIRVRFEETRAVVEATGLALHLGAEYYFDGDFYLAAKAKTLLTLGERSRFVLTELPQARLPPRFSEVLFEIRLAGYVLVIAHPERSQPIQADPSGMLDVFLRAGVLLQLDLGSLIGHYGEPARKAAIELMRLGAYHVAACDLHRPKDAQIIAPALRELEQLLKKRKAEGRIRDLVDLHPRLILENAEREKFIAV